MKDGARQARAKLKVEEQPSEDEVIVRIPVTAYVSFPRKRKRLTGEGLVRCVCTNDGEVCVCRGQCDFPPCCDADGGSRPIVP